ncbi:MAG: hypothetical protein JXR76_28495 [Deltaproteobacteria bacterium]|nr:hypothetical protein [Deltaproteobacteria bacterium]
MKKSDIRMTLHMSLAMVLLLSIGACDNSLEERYDEFLDSAPSACKNYCEIMSSCDRTSDGGTYRYESLASRVHVCVAECSAYAAEGAYAWFRADNDGIDRNMDAYVSGGALMDALGCLFDLGVFGCNYLEDGSYKIVFSPVSRGICEDSAKCIDRLNVDYHYAWQENSGTLGGSCQGQGADTIDFPYF